MRTPLSLTEAWNERGLTTHAIVANPTDCITADRIKEALSKAFCTDITLKRIFANVENFACLLGTRVDHTAILGDVINRREADFIETGYFITTKGIEVYCDESRVGKPKVLPYDCPMVLQVEQVVSGINRLEEAIEKDPLGSIITTPKDSNPIGEDHKLLDNLLKVMYTYKHSRPNILDWGLLIPQTVVHAVQTYIDQGLAPEVLAIPASKVVDLTTSSEFVNFFDPATKLEMTTSGFVGSLYNLKVYTDIALPVDKRFIHGIKLLYK